MSLFSSFFGQPHQESVITTTLDMVTRTASLASNPDSIDPLLDNVRTITSKLDANQTPSAADNDTLLQVYLNLEAYLAAKEPIRSFTKTELRAKFSPALRQQLEAFESKRKGVIK